MSSASESFDVFLAHNSKDKPEIETIGTELKRRGLTPWIDKEQIPPGRWFQDLIQAAIPNVKSAAVFFGPNGVGRWQAVEIRSFVSQCVERGIPVIPVLLPGVKEFPPTLVFMKELNWVRFATGIDEVEALDNLEWGITGKHPKRSGILPKSLAENAGGKVKKVKPPAKKKQPRTLVVDSSGSLVYLHRYFFQADSVDAGPDRTITVRILSKNAADDATVQSLQATSGNCPKEIAFAHRNDGCLVRVKSVQSQTQGNSCVWIVTLISEQIQYGGSPAEGSYQGPEGSFTADEIVELRAKRILLDAAPTPVRGSRQFGFLENLIKGSGPLPIASCVLRELYPSLQGNPSEFLAKARLAAIFALKAGDVVERVVDLTLGPILSGRVHVRFKGMRREKYLNQPATEIQVEGDCLLG